MISEEEREQRYRKMVIDLFKLVRKDVSPNKVNDLALKKIVANNKRDAAWFAFSSKGYMGLEWWCDLVSISSLRVKRRVRELLNEEG